MLLVGQTQPFETIHQEHPDVNTLPPFHPTHFYQNKSDLSRLLLKYLHI